MPMAIPIVLAAGATFAGGLATAGVGITIAGVALSAGTLGAISAGLSIAGTLAGMLLAPKPPKPKFADGSASVKQAVPPRVRCYGTYRLAGAYIYFVSTDEGDLKAITNHCAHEVDAFVEHWLADEPVTIDEDGFVDSGVYDNYDPILPVKVVNYLGTPDQSIAGIADEWTVDHRGRGLCCTYVQYSDMKAELQQKVFANGAPPYRVTLRGAKVFDPRLEGTGPGQHDPEDESTWTWSDNAALVILDYLTRTEFGVPVGFGLPFTRMNLDSFAEAADVSDQLIPKKAGGTEKRWRSCGAYELTEERKSVLSDLLDACAGRLTQGPDGRLGLSVGAGKVAGADVAGMPAAAVRVTEDHIIGFDFGPGVTALDRVNEVRATYVSADQSWAEVEAGIHRDQDAIDRNGLESSAIKLRFVPAEGQAQRVARAGLMRGNPTLAGKITGSLKLLDAWGERWIRLVMTELDVDQIFEVTGLRFNPANLTVEMDLTSYDGWWDWDPGEDERDKADIPLPPPPVPDTPEPTGVVAAIMHRQQNAQTVVATMVVSWDAPDSASLQAQGRWREDPAGALQMVRVEPDATSFETPPLEDGKAYRGEVRFVGSRNTASDWVTAAPITAVADPVAPASPTNLTAQANSPATGQVTVSAKAPNDPKHVALRFYRNGSSTFAGATLINGPLYCAPLSTQTYIDAPPPGDWWYFATSSNGSNVASAAAGGVLAEVSPAAPVITTSPATIGQTNPTVAGTAVAGATVKVFANAVLNVTTTADGSGNWSVALIALGSGAQSITATATVGGNESAASGSVTLTVVWYDPDASGHADFRGGNYRLNGAGSTLAGIFDTITTSAQIVTNANGSLHPIAANTAPLCDRGLELWENRTNRCTNRNANPTDLTGVTPSGDVLATLTRVDDSANMGGGSILNALLTAATINGFVYKLDNSAGSTDAFATISGTVAVVGACRGSIVYRGSAGRIEIGGVTAVSFGASTPYARVGGSRTAAATSEQMRIAAPAGAAIYFILNQLENGAFDTAPIVVNAATAARNAPLITRTVGADFNATEGFFGARAKVAAGVTNSGIVVGSLQTTTNDANLIQFTTATALRGLTQVAAAATGLASQALTATNMTTGVYGFKANDFGFSANGLATVTDVSGAVPTGTPAKITISINTSSALNGVIEQVKWGTTKPATATIQAKSGWTTVT
jgi:hypothetical protein